MGKNEREIAPIRPKQKCQCKMAFLIYNC